MSGNETQPFDLGGMNLKEWSFIILMLSIAIVFIVFAIGMASAMMSDNTTVTFSGDIDLGQFTGIIIGIAMVSTTLVAQQLISRNQAAAVAATDKVWSEDK